MRFPGRMFTVSNHFCSGGGGGGRRERVKSVVEVTVISKEENSTFVPIMAKNSASVLLIGSQIPIVNETI